MSILKKLKEEQQAIKNLNIAKQIIEICKTDNNEVDVVKAIKMLEQKNISLTYIQQEVKKHDYLLTDEIKQTISMILGLPYEKIISMKNTEFEKFIKTKANDMSTYNLDDINSKFKLKK